MKALEKVWAYVGAGAPVSDALGAAVEAARRSGAALTLVGAIGREEDRIFRTSFGERVMRMVRDDREAQLKDLERVARSSLPAGSVASVLLEGEVPWHSVIAHAVEHRPDLVVVPAGARGSGFDSTAQHFFRKCPAPVWSVLAGSRAFPRRVLAAIDPGVRGSDERLLARGILDLARQIAAGSPLELHVAYAWRLMGEEVIRSRLGARSAEEHLARQQEVAYQEVEDLIVEAEAKALVTATHLPKGDAAWAIAMLAERLDADLVVLGTAGRTGLSGFLIGSTAEEILARLQRSAAVVKPPGFVSPVRPRSASPRARNP